MLTDITAISKVDGLPKNYGGMVSRIADAMPEIQRDSAAFHKSHSQFMYATLDITPLTTIRAIQQTLAEIDRTKSALQEAHIARRRRSVDMQEISEKLSQSELGKFERERLEIDLMEAQAKDAAANDLTQGAIRKLSYMVAQYRSLMSKLGKTELSEADYEADEARYHVMTCMKQALCAARARGGIIDEGNQIYLFDMGLPAADAQRRIREFLELELKLLSDGKAPTHEMTLRFLESCADEWKDCSAALARRRGVPMFDALSLHAAS